MAQVVLLPGHAFEIHERDSILATRTLRSSFIVLVTAAALGACGYEQAPPLEQQEVPTDEFGNVGAPEPEGTDDQSYRTTSTVGTGTTEQAVMGVSLAAGTTLKVTTPLNLRSAPKSATNNILLVMPYGALPKTAVAGYGTNGYYNVTYHGTTGWAYGSYLKQMSSDVIKWGVHPEASDALKAAGLTSAKIMQTIGDYDKSAGTHAIDGYVNGEPYSGATDISVSGMTETQIRNLLEKLASLGVIAWYRKPGYDGWPIGDGYVAHIHAVFVGAKIKASLRDQYTSWVAGRNGLASNTDYKFYNWTASSIDFCQRLYPANNW
jgi:hypothetical protein